MKVDPFVQQLNIDKTINLLLLSGPPLAFNYSGRPTGPVTTCFCVVVVKPPLVADVHKPWSSEKPIQKQGNDHKNFLSRDMDLQRRLVELFIFS